MKKELPFKKSKSDSLFPTEFFKNKFKALLIMSFIVLGTLQQIQAQVVDTDGDGVVNSLDLDDDNDGILDTDENDCYGTPLAINLTGVTNASKNISNVILGTTTFNGVYNPLSTSTWNIQPLGGNGSLRMGVINKSQFLEYTITFDKPVKLNLKQAVQNGFFDNGEIWTIRVVGSTLNVNSPNITHSFINQGAGGIGPELINVVGNGTSSTSFMPNVQDGHIPPASSMWSITSDDYITSLTIRYQGNVALLPLLNNAGPIGLFVTCIARDTDKDGIYDYLDFDSDNDGCSDVLEAGHTDPDNDGILGSSPVVVDGSGQVTGQRGYTGTNSTVITATQTTLSTSPTDQSINMGDNTTFTVSGLATSTTTFAGGVPNYAIPPAINTSANVVYQWQENRNDGAGWNAISNGGIYSGANTNTLTLTTVPFSHNGYGYRAVITNTNNACVNIQTSSANLKVNLIPFSCDKLLFLSQYDISGATSLPATLKNLDSNTNPFVITNFGDNSHGISYNAIGYNPIDNFIYGLQTDTNNLVKIGQGGFVQVLGPVTGLPFTSYVSGEIDNNGNFYVKRVNSSQLFYKINVVTKMATLIPLSLPVSTLDFAYNVLDGLLYGVQSNTGQLVTINPVNGVVTFIGVTPTTGVFRMGAIYGSSTGNIFGNHNDGTGFYQYNLTTGEKTVISASPGASGNDGAHCVNAPITFGSDLSVTKTDGATCYIPGTTVTYTIVAENHGPYGVVNAAVFDGMPAGIPLANISYTAVESPGSSSAVSGTQTGMINDFVSLPVDGTVTYTVTVNVPLFYTGDLTNSVNITVPINNIDTNLSNNTATDTNNPFPIANAGTDFSKTCTVNPTGMAIGAAAVAGVTYSWSPSTGLSSATVSNPTANPTATTTYTVTATDTASGCMATDAVTVTVDTTLPVANAGTDFTKTCTVNPTGMAIGDATVAGVTYSWSPSTGLSSATVSNPTANPTVTTTYTVTATNTASGCTATDAVTVTVDTTLPVANAGTDFTKTCTVNPTGMAIGAAAVAGVTYSWSPSTGLLSATVSNPTANPTVTTTYTVTATYTASGCTTTDAVTVTVDTTLPIANAGTDFTKTCTVNPTGMAIGATAVAGVTYSWSPSTGLSSATVSNPTANPTATTTYIVTATNTASGCMATDAVTVTVDTTLPVANAGIDFTKTCTVNPTGMAIGSATVAGVTYSWSPSTGLSSATVSNPTANPTATTIYTVTATNTASGCTATDAVTVTVDTTLPVANAGTDFSKTCTVNPIGMAIGSATVAGVTYSWSPSTGLSSATVSNPTANPTSTTTYTVTAINTASGCTATDAVTVTVDTTLPVANAGTDFTKTCTVNPTGMAIGDVTVAGVTYSWSPSTGLSSATVSNPTANPIVTTTYTVTATNTASGCTTTDAVTVTVDTTLPVANAGTDFTKTCTVNPTGMAIGAAAVAGTTYSWSPSTGLSSATVSNPTANPTVTTTYTVTATNTASGCTATDAVTVTVDTTLPVANAGTDFTKTCTVNPTGMAIGAATVAGTTYSWSPSTGLSSATVSNPTANPTVTTTYTVTATNTASGCTATDAVTVTVDTTLPVVSITGVTAICVGSTTTLSPTTGGTWGSSDPTVATVTNSGVVTGVSAGTATFTFTSTANGCSSSPTSVITIKALPIVSSTTTSVCSGSTTALSPTTGGTWVSSDLSVATVTDTGVVTVVSAGIVTFTFTDSTTNCSSSTSLIVYSCSLEITKDGSYVDANADGITNVGDVINYIFVVKNTGNVTLANVTVTDNNAVITGGPLATLAVGASNTTTFTGVHTLTQSEINVGNVYNLATATGTPPSGTPVTGTSTDPTPCATCPIDPSCLTCTITPLTQTPSIAITKDGSYVDANADGITNVGDVINYTFVVKNTGNVTLTNVTVTDNNAVITGGPLATLGVGASDTTTFTGVHTLTQSDINTGNVYNLATATGTPPSGTPVTGTSTDPTPCATCPTDPACPTCTITPLAQTPSIAITKDGSYVDANADGITNVGDVINYTFVVKNTGNVTLTNVTVTDNNAVITGGPLATLEVGASNTTTFTGVHTLTQSEINVGNVYNLATATGTPPSGTPVTGTSTDPTPCATCTIDPSCPTCTITPLTQTPSIAITKDGSYVDANADGITNVGDVINYTFVVKNTGNVTLTNVTVTDNNAVITGGPLATLGVGTSDTTIFTGVHTLTQSDINAGNVYNLATATGTPPSGTPVTGTSTDPTPCATCPVDPACPTCTITPLTQTLSITITKDGSYVDANADGITNVGDVINYIFVVKNTGNITLTNVRVTDNNAVITGGPLATLGVGASDTTTCTGVHTLTQSDINAGNVYNLATATGTPPSGTPVTGTSRDPTPCATCPTDPACPTCTITPLTQRPLIAIIKTALFKDDNGDGFAQAGEKIVYSFVVTNTGNVPLTNIIVTDTDLPGLVMTGSPIPVLGIGMTNDTAYSATYAITQADINLGSVTNQAIASGTSPNGTIVKDLSDDSNNLDDQRTVVPISGCTIEVFNAVSPNGDGLNDVFYIRGLECYPDNTVEIYNRWGVLVFERDHYNNDDRAFRGVSEGRVTINQSKELPVGTYYYIFKYKDNASNVHEKAGYLYVNRK
ncbi:DUF7507 domain-containing protein [Flavobacterium collinsii]|uniref:BIG2 domain-containing protein n=1 Tax=Flavobacterium collinsii TaxID=1114861 RepID=A0ABN7EM75_9FLAO|nr:gliding motility-associated C-terminal domain-containing protein [Flavobacterium collinsii]CAA9200440.1 hypothetical protein FLACOL7796_03251 [Flavobacterium collinsii]